MDVLTTETCWALNNEIIKQVTSRWWWTFRFHNMRGISWLGEKRLASREGLCSMEWVRIHSRLFFFNGLEGWGSQCSKIVPKISWNILREFCFFSLQHHCNRLIYAKIIKAPAATVLDILLGSYQKISGQYIYCQYSPPPWITFQSRWFLILCHSSTADSI